MELMTDASVFMAVLLNQTEKQKIISLTTRHDLVAPAVLPYEIGNALSALCRRQRLDSKQIVRGFTQFSSIPVRLIEPDIDKALRLVARFLIYAYDAYYLEIAVRHNMALLTLDKQMVRLAKELNLKVLEVSNEDL